MKNKILVSLAVMMVTATGCGKMKVTQEKMLSSLSPIGSALEDGSIVHGRAIYQVGMSNELALMKQFQNLMMPSAYAASSGSTTVTYTNAASTNFTINVGNFVPNGFKGQVLDLGTLNLNTISDNNLKVCGSNNSTKCTQAVIRVYTTGSVAGFVNTSDSSDQYGVPVYAGSLNPNSAVGLNAAGSVQVQTLAIPSSKKTLSLSDFPSPQYSVTADFTNGGAGNYSMSFVVEYALLP